MKTGRTSLPVAVALLLLALEACGQGAPTPPSSPPAVVAPSDTASIDVAAASAPTVTGSTLRPIRANLSVAIARTALEAAGQTCDQRLAPAAEAGVVELVCRDLALDTEVRVAGT